MDGVPANGRSIFVPAGETVKKIITVRQTDQSILDYEGVEIWFLSQYQPIKINDKCKLNVHFKPSSSPVDLAITDPVLNIETLSRNEGNLEMKVKNFDRLFKGMTNIGVEYRFEGATQWTRPSELSFLVNPKTPAYNLNYGGKDHKVQVAFFVNNYSSFGSYDLTKKVMSMQIIEGAIFLDGNQTAYLKEGVPFVFVSTKKE